MCVCTREFASVSKSIRFSHVSKELCRSGGVMSLEQIAWTGLVIDGWHHGESGVHLQFLLLTAPNFYGCVQSRRAA